MNTVKVIAPETEDFPGTVHVIPEADLESFLEKGWKEEGGKEETKKQKSK